MEELTKRPEKLPGATYKLRWTGIDGDTSYYVTINHIDDEKGIRPFEIFIISQDVTHAPWMAALTRMISAIFRRGGDIRFVAEELQEIYDVVGPQVVGNTQERSLLSLIGKVIARHLDDINYEQAVEDILILQPSYNLDKEEGPS